MATPGQRVDDQTIRIVRALHGAGKKVSFIAFHCQLSRPTVRKIVKAGLTSFQKHPDSGKHHAQGNQSR